MNKLIIFIFILSASCQTKRSFEGIWETSSVKYKDKSFRAVPAKYLYEFLKKSVKITQFGYPESGKFDTLVTHEFSAQYLDSTVTISIGEEQLTLLFHTISDDSLVFSTNQDEETISTLKKLKTYDNSSVEPSNLIGHLFEVNSFGNTHKLDFINDSLLFDGGYHSESRWTLSKYKDFNFLLTNAHFFETRPISMLVDGTIVLTSNTTTKPSPLIAIKPAINKKDLFGSWKEFERSFGPPLPFDYDTLQSLIITQDSISSTRFNKINKRCYNLSNDGEFIYFPSNKSYEYNNWNLPTPWKILKLDSEDLFVELAQRGDTTIIKYKKSW